MSKLKLVSIIMATYNRAGYIAESLRSIQNQTYENFECLIIDDGGNDNTFEVIEPILKTDSRFSFQKRTNNYIKGLPGTRNCGLDLAKGDYIIFFDDDDIVHPQNLELCVLELEDKSIYFCRYIRNVFFEKFDYSFDLSKEYNFFYIDKMDIEKILKNELPLNSCAVMWKKECFENNQFTESLMYAEEWELYSRIISYGFRGISIEKCLFFGRKHLRSNTGEFYSNNPIRRSSKKNAVLLVIENLESKGLLTDSLLRYFIQMSPQFKEYNLFESIIDVSKLSFTRSYKWKFFYRLLPLRLTLYRLKKQLMKL